MRKEDRINGLSRDEILEIARSRIKEELAQLPEDDLFHREAKKISLSLKQRISRKSWQDAVCDAALGDIKAILYHNGMREIETKHRINCTLHSPFSEYRDLEEKAARSALQAMGETACKDAAKPAASTAEISVAAAGEEYLPQTARNSDGPRPLFDRIASRAMSAEQER